MPFCFATKRPRGYISHGILVPGDVQRRQRARALCIHTQCEDSEELFSDKARPTGHPLDPADCRGIVTEKCYAFFCEAFTCMFDHKPQEEQPGHFQIRVCDVTVPISVRYD